RERIRRQRGAWLRRDARPRSGDQPVHRRPGDARLPALDRCNQRGCATPPSQAARRLGKGSQTAMFQFAQRRKLYYLISAAIIFPGILAMAISAIQNGSPVRLSIDFAGGTLMEVSFVENFDEQEIRDALNAYGLEDIVAQRLDPISTDNIEGVNDAAGSRWQIRTKEIQDIDDRSEERRVGKG